MYSLKETRKKTIQNVLCRLYLKREYTSPLHLPTLEYIISVKFMVKQSRRKNMAMLICLLSSSSHQFRAYGRYVNRRVPFTDVDDFSLMGRVELTYFRLLGWQIIL